MGELAALMSQKIINQTPMVSSSECSCNERSQSMDVGSWSARHPVARAYATSEGASSLPPSPVLSNASPDPDSVMRYTSASSVWDIEEYVQYHKEPMAGGWREFYTPRSMHTPSTKSSRSEFFTPRSMHTPSTKSSRRGSKSVHMYRSHSASGLALERSLSKVEDW